MRSWQRDGGETQVGLNVAAWPVETLGQIGRNPLAFTPQCYVYARARHENDACVFVWRPICPQYALHTIKKESS
jgi:hypothetical protein